MTPFRCVCSKQWQAFTVQQQHLAAAQGLQFITHSVAEGDRQQGH